MSVKPDCNLLPSDRKAIRAIFLARRTAYPMRDAANLLRLSMADALAWAESGQLHVAPARTREQLVNALVTWRDLASAALLRWNVMQINEALAGEADRVLPRLLRLAELRSVQLPEYQVRLLEAVARDAGVSVDELVFTALLDLETTGSPDEIENLLPGYKEAITFPDA
ncbi:MAG TPA: hypothetical protein VF911_08850 [Thermoanaerobaculia bacterium]|jgi:hypothetical protein